MRFFVQHTAGLGPLVHVALVADLPGARVLQHDESALVLRADRDPDGLARLPYLRNAFVVLGDVARPRSLDRGATDLARVVDTGGIRVDRGARDSPFRIMFHIDGTLATVARQTREQLESAIARATRGRVQGRGGGTDYWVVGRRDDRRLLLCRRLPTPPRPKTPAGALSPELAAALVRAAPRRASDRFLDPFAGSGAIPEARAQTPAASIRASDLAAEPRRSSRVEWRREDATELPSIPDHSIDVVVTDPPWGEHEHLPGGWAAFAERMLQSLRRVLAPGGHLVLLVNRDNADDLRRLLDEHGFGVEQELGLLVNGHPAVVVAARASGSGASESD